MSLMAFAKKPQAKDADGSSVEASASEPAPAAPFAELVKAKPPKSGIVICRIYAGQYFDTDRTYGAGDEVAIPESEVAKLAHCMRPVEE